ncbi:MAG TPA: DUF255 domain-containing protein [Longimicrobiales bacterium]|nr:DUF255 domain-containing protein [Longimicrobiales bacterium]
MTEPLQFSHRPNRAAEIHWRPWGADAFKAASATGSPVLLAITASWCRWCAFMDETTYSAASVIKLINDHFVPVRVNGDAAPHVQDRYIAGGWPTTAFLTPTGEVLWSGTFVEAEPFEAAARAVLSAWSERRAELEEEIRRRRHALEVERGRARAMEPVRREAADDVLLVLRDTFDARNGGFGGPPKFPAPEAIELCLTPALDDDPGWAAMAERTLDGMLAGELHDDVDGGFFRYALAADWTEPRREKVLGTQAGFLAAYALGASVRDRADWRAAAESAVDWAETRLSRRDGLWGTGQAADPEYFAADVRTRAALEEPPVDLRAYTALNAAWIRSLADAGRALGERDWIERAQRGLDALLATMRAPDDLLFHGAEAPRRPGLLIDPVETVGACMAVARAGERPELQEEAVRLAHGMQRHLWAEDGAFLDHVPGDEDVGALRYPDRPFVPNARAARLFLDLSAATGDGGLRDLAERTLSVLAPVAGRYGTDAAPFALAVETYFRGGA